MWLYLRKIILGIIVSLAYGQDYLEPVPGCYQYRVEFDSTAIDENCAFTDPSYTYAVFATAGEKADCTIMGGVIMQGQYRTESYRCPDNGHLYTYCCTKSDCETTLASWQAFCEGQLKETDATCTLDGTFLLNRGCFTPWTASPGSGVELTELYAIRSTLEYMTYQNGDYYTQVIDDNQNILDGVTSLQIIGQNQLSALQDIRQQAIKSRFEQGGILGNIELIAEEQLALLDSIKNKEYHVNNEGVIDAINDNHNQLMNATGTGGEEFDTIGDYSDDIDTSVGGLVGLGDYYSDSAGPILEAGVDSIMPNYDSLSSNILNAFGRYTDSDVCPFQPIEMENWVNGGGSFEVDLGICEMTMIGDIKVIEFMRTLINLIVYIGCAWMIHRTLISALSGKEV